MSRETDIVRELLGPDRVKDVRVVSDVNVDGERILRVFVIYEGSKGDLTVDEMSSITSALWGNSLTHSDAAFPIPSFISSEDDKVLGAA